MYITTCITFNCRLTWKLSSNKVACDSSFVLVKMFQDVNSVFSPDQSVLSFSSSAQSLHGCIAPPIHAVVRFFVRYTNHPFGHQRRYTKRHHNRLIADSEFQLTDAAVDRD